MDLTKYCNTCDGASSLKYIHNTEMSKSSHIESRICLGRIEAGFYG